MVESNQVFYNDGKVLALGYNPSEIKGRVGYQFFTEKIHPDDYERVMKNMRNHLEGKSSAYEVEYRIRAKDGQYKWYYDRGKITSGNKDGKPLVVAGIVFDVTHQKKLEQELLEAKLMVILLETKF